MQLFYKTALSSDQTPTLRGDVLGHVSGEIHSAAEGNDILAKHQACFCDPADGQQALALTTSSYIHLVPMHTYRVQDGGKMVERYLVYQGAVGPPRR